MSADDEEAYMAKVAETDKVEEKYRAINDTDNGY